MNELIRITKNGTGQDVVSARELHKFLEVKNHFTQWFDDNKTMLDESVDYKAIKVYLTHENGVGGIYSKDYAVTLDCAKELAMLSRVEKGKQARKYFIECEKIAKDIQETNPRVPKTFREALLLAAEQQEVIEKQILRIEVMKPKEQFYDQVTGSETCFDMADVAKVCNLGIGRSTLFQFLRDNKILRKNNTPYQQNIDNGYFRVIESKYNKPDGSVNINLKTVVYQKGIDFIVKRFVGRNVKAM